MKTSAQFVKVFSVFVNRLNLKLKWTGLQNVRHFQLTQVIQKSNQILIRKTCFKILINIYVFFQVVQFDVSFGKESYLITFSKVFGVEKSILRGKFKYFILSLAKISSIKTEPFITCMVTQVLISLPRWICNFFDSASVSLSSVVFVLSYRFLVSDQFSNNDVESQVC